MSFRSSDLDQLSQTVRDANEKHFGEGKVYTISLSTTVNRAMKDRVDAVCKRRGISTSQFLREAIRGELVMLGDDGW